MDVGRGRDFSQDEKREKLFGQRDLRYLVLSETRGDPSTLFYEVQ